MKQGQVIVKTSEGSETFTYYYPDDEHSEVTKLRRKMFIESIRSARILVGDGYVWDYYAQIASNDFMPVCEMALELLSKAYYDRDKIKLAVNA